MMNQIGELRNELTTLEHRRLELEEERAGAKSTLAADREDLLQGAAGSTKAVTAAQSTVTALVEAIAALDERIAAKRAELAAATAKAERAAKIKELAALGGIGQERLDAYLDARARANEALKVAAAEMVATFESLQDARNEFLDAASPLVPNLYTAELTTESARLLDELVEAGGATDGVLVCWIGTTSSTLDRKGYALPDCQPFNQILHNIFQRWQEVNAK